MERITRSGFFGSGGGVCRKLGKDFFHALALLDMHHLNARPLQERLRHALARILIEQDASGSRCRCGGICIGCLLIQNHLLARG